MFRFGIGMPHWNFIVPFLLNVRGTPMGTDELKKTIDELEQEVIDELNENPNRMYNVIFPYQVRFLIHDNDDDHPPTEVVINTHTQEYFSARNPQDVLFQKDQADQYCKEGLTKYIQKYVRDSLWYVDPEDAHLTYTGKPEVREMTQEELSTLKIGKGNDDD